MRPQTETPPFEFLDKAACVLLFLQAALLFFNVFVSDEDGNGLTGVLVATLVFLVINRRYVRNPVQGGGLWVGAWRMGVLVLLAAITLVVEASFATPQTTANVAPTVIAMLLWAVIALKGAAVGKLKPGGPLGLRVGWTCSSRLAWERAHRTLGRVLFFAGLAGLACSPFMPFFVNFAAVAAVVVSGVSLALLEAYRAWREESAPLV